MYQPHGIRYFWLALYAALTIGVFAWQFVGFATPPNLDLAGYWLPCSRGFAQVCLLQMVGLLVAVMYSLLRKIRTTFLDAYLPLDDNLNFHKLAGYLLILSGWLHSLCHIYGFQFKIQEADSATWENGVLASHLIGPQPRFIDLLSTVPGWTGCGLLICSIVVTPFTFFRKRTYRLFWYTHYIYYTVFILLFIFHGTSGWLYTPQAIFWCGVPFILYLFDRRHRVRPLRHEAEIQSAEFIGESVLKLKIENPLRSFIPGMHLYMNISKLSHFEWHPFTITSVPTEPHLTFLIENAGSWTTGLFEGVKNHSITTISIDGPIGSPAQRFRHYETIVCICSGLGITPFLSILSERPDANIYWVSRDLTCLHGVGELENNSIHRYYTGKEKLNTSSFIQNGRPKIDEILSQFQNNATVAVFFCGQPNFEMSVRQQCLSRKVPFFAERFQ